MLALATDSVTNFTAAPLRVATWLGLISFFFCLCMFVYVAVAFTLDSTVRGWASVIATVLFLGGAQLLASVCWVSTWAASTRLCRAGRRTLSATTRRLMTRWRRVATSWSSLATGSAGPPKPGRCGLFLSRLSQRVVCRRSRYRPHPLS